MISAAKTKQHGDTQQNQLFDIGLQVWPCRICDLYNVVRLNWAACGTAWGVSEPCCLEPVRLQPCFGLKVVLQDHKAKIVADWIVCFRAVKERTGPAMLRLRKF